MKKDNIVASKSFDFAVRIIKLYKYLTNIKKEYVLSKQILRSGTSIGANISEAIVSQSRKEFIAKLNISYKESTETIYWIRLLLETDYINNEMANSLLIDGEVLSKLLCSIIKSSNSKN